MDGFDLVITDEFIASCLSAFREIIDAIETRLQAEFDRAEGLRMAPDP